MEETLTPVLATESKAIFAYDLTLLEAPAQLQDVDQTMVEPLKEVTVEHWDPEVAESWPQRSW